jgi:hypothetical protein
MRIRKRGLAQVEGMRTCIACSHSERETIDQALVSGEPLRNIAKRVSISPAGLLRHKNHVSQAIVKASEEREEQLGESLLYEMRRVQRKAWELLSKTESEGDHRASIVALREVRECLESLGDMLVRSDVVAKADAANAGPEQIKITFIDASLCPDCRCTWNERNERYHP